MVLSLVGAMVGGGLFAHFSDVEVSEENVFTAGVIDIEVDVDGAWYNGVPFPIFSIHPDVKPCHGGETTLSLHLYGNPALVDIALNVTEDLDNTIVEPEDMVDGVLDGLDGTDDGDLDSCMWIKIWHDDGIDQTPGTGDEGEGDNIQQPEEGFIYEGYADQMIGAIPMGEMIPCITYYLGFLWHFDQPDNVNIAMSDSWGFNAVITANQIVQ
jgi:predicted ribosomally synthesized peptide with SipW-like signal peptide